MKNPQSTSRKPQSSLTSLELAYEMLTRRAHTEHELVQSCLPRGFADEVVARTVARLKEQGYLNDRSFASDQAERLQKRIGQDGIRAKLAQKGLAEATIEQVVAEQSGEAESLEARQLLASRFSADALKQPREYARAFRFLLRRGYAYDVVENLLGDVPTDREK